MQWIVTLTPDVADDPLRAISKPPVGADLVEVRMDLLPDLQISDAIAACPLPVLATYRSQNEGGRGSGDAEVRNRLLGAANTAGAALIDAEWNRDVHTIARLGIEPERLVVSWHDVHGTPDDLASIAAGMLEGPGFWVKVVPTSRNLSDLERVLALTCGRSNIPRKNRRRLVAFSMGSPGVASRFLAPLRGAPIGFAAWSDSTAAAPGQLAADRMRASVGHLVGPPRRLFGVVGRDVAQSLSPVLHAAGFRALSTPDLMIPISVETPEELEHLFAPAGATLFDRIGLRAWGWAVTSPYKGLAADAATLCAPRVRRARAANTLVLKNDRVLAENTDADGVVGSLTATGVVLRGARALVQGTGGAARGAAVGLHTAGADVRLRSRSDERAHRTADEIGVGWCGSSDTAHADILVNATPLGTQSDDPVPFSIHEIVEACAVVDMVYGPQPTPLELEVKDREKVWIDGRTMLAYQGIAQFAAFTESLPPRAAMLEALNEFRPPSAPRP